MYQDIESSYIDQLHLLKVPKSFPTLTYVLYQKNYYNIRLSSLLLSNLRLELNKHSHLYFVLQTENIQSLISTLLFG